MQIFGLRILSILLSCLDTLLYFVDNHDIVNYLAQCQHDAKVEGKVRWFTVHSYIPIYKLQHNLPIGSWYAYFLNQNDITAFESVWSCEVKYSHKFKKSLLVGSAENYEEWIICYGY